MQRAADMASVMGIDMQMALDSVAGAAKGNFTMMDNLGVAMNATNVGSLMLLQRGLISLGPVLHKQRKLKSPCRCSLKIQSSMPVTSQENPLKR